MLDFAWQRARADGRKQLSCITAWHLPDLGLARPDNCGAGFARVHGFSTALDSVQLRMELDSLPQAALDDVIQRAEAEAGGYQVVRWRGRVPERYVNDLAYLSSRMMADAPTGDLGWESENIDAARYRREEQTYLDRGEAGWHTGALHLDSGRLVGLTTIRHHHVDWHAQQGNTIVEPRHRGHRLGLLVRAANQRWLRQECPTVRAIDTYNAVENSHMIAINEQLGYRPLYAWQHWQLEMSA